METKMITVEQAGQHMIDCLQGESPKREIKAWRLLEEKLLSLGGARVIRKGREPFGARLVRRGRLFSERVRRVRGEQHRCHTNAADLWAHDVEGRRLVTGYALSGGLWMAHSWVLEGGELLETTRRYDSYYGVELVPIEALMFFTFEVVTLRYPNVAEAPPDFWTARPGILPLVDQMMEADPRRHAVRQQPAPGTPDRQATTKPSRARRRPASPGGAPASGNTATGVRKVPTSGRRHKASEPSTTG